MFSSGVINERLLYLSSTLSFVSLHVFAILILPNIVFSFFLTFVA